MGALTTDNGTARENAESIAAALSLVSGRKQRFVAFTLDARRSMRVMTNVNKGVL
jgi:hypothetical protein